jgi:hypothetical protein
MGLRQAVKTVVRSFDSRPRADLMSKETKLLSSTTGEGVCFTIWRNVSAWRTTDLTVSQCYNTGLPAKVFRFNSLDFGSWGDATTDVLLMINKNLLPQFHHLFAILIKPKCADLTVWRTTWLTSDACARWLYRLVARQDLVCSGDQSIRDRGGANIFSEVCYAGFQEPREMYFYMPHSYGDGYGRFVCPVLRSRWNPSSAELCR